MSETTNVRCAKNCGGCGGHDPECAIINATPPTPDLDAVVARDVNETSRDELETRIRAACNHTHPDLQRLGMAVANLAYGHGLADDVHGARDQMWNVLVAADALLAAVSRPAEARGEPSEAMVEEYEQARALLLQFVDEDDEVVWRDGRYNWARALERFRLAALATQREQTP